MASWQGANVRVTQRKRQRSAETVEASLHRLTNAYTVAMECVGLFHKEKKETAAWAARSALEKAVLADPWIQACQTGLSTLRSAGHRQKVEQLAYLALLNYGDLLIAGLGNPTEMPSNILERGVVKAVQETALWNDRSKTETLRLAVQSYLDAVAVDASDPTTWLKLACAARRIGNPQYERVIRYALERAVSVREVNIPPHALAVRALAELKAEEASRTELIMRPSPLPNQETLVLHIPRNSWTALGRLLLKTARDTSSSEKLQLKLSPLLLLDTKLLPRLCSFLGNSSALEATCRALSASVLAARTQLNRQRRRASLAATVAAAAATTATSTTTLPTQQTLTEEESVPPTSPTKEPTISDERPPEASVTKRVSKRVQSQIISSGKRSQRSYRRHSVEYCLVAATLGCTSSDPTYRAMLKGNPVSSKPLSPVAASAVSSNQQQQDSLAASTAALSLRDFVQGCSTGISPLKCLFCFVAKCSVEISTVVASDSSGSLLVNSCLLDCLNFMSRRTRLTEQLVCAWSSATRHQYLATQDELLAIDILHAELRFQRCESAVIVDGSYDGDANFVSTVVPFLVHQAFPQPALRVRCLWLAANYYLWRARLSSSLGESRDAEAEGLRYIEATLGQLPTNSVIPTPHLASPRRKGLHWRELSAVTLNSFGQDIQASSIVLVAQEQFLEVTSRFTGLVDSQSLTEEDSDCLYDIGTKLLARYDAAADSSDVKLAELVEDFLSTQGDVLLSWLQTAKEADKDDERIVESWFFGLLPIEQIKTVGQLLYVIESPCSLTILVTCVLVRAGNEASIASLLVNMVSAVVNYAESTVSKKRKNSNEDSLYSDDENSSSDSDDDQGSSTVVQASKLEQLATLVPLLVRRLISLTPKLDLEARESLRRSNSFTLMFDRGLRFVADWFHISGSNNGEDLETLCSLRMAYEWACNAGSEVPVELTRTYINGLMNVAAKQRASFSLSRIRTESRSEMFKITRKRCDLVANVFCQFGSLLSNDLVQVEDGNVVRSSIFEASSNSDPAFHLCQFADSLTWFWRAVINSSFNEMPGGKSKRPGWNLDQFGRDRLRVPLALAITALCGAGSCSVKLASVPRNSGSEDEGVALLEFYDSDTSATCWAAEETGQDSSEFKTEEMVRVIGQAVSCVTLALDSVTEKEATTFDHVERYMTSDGPLLPLVVVRVLNNFSRIIFDKLSDTRPTAPKEDVDTSYPVGTRAIGNLIDASLYKAYRCLHGFTITNGDVSTSYSTPTSTTFSPENIEAASMLFRCLTRAYSGGRKLPPKAALEAVAAVLPKPKENSKTRSIRDFLFVNKVPSATASDLLSLISSGERDESREELSTWKSEIAEDDTEEVVFIRRGLNGLMAQGQLPTGQDTGNLNESRPLSVQVEEEVGRKFFAIVESLCCGKTLDGEEWFRASQCLTVKADTIADRIGLSLGFARGENFGANSRTTARKTAGLSCLIQSQENEARLKQEGWASSLGADLSVYVTHNWSSHSSLEECMNEVGRSIQRQVEEQSEENSDIVTTQILLWNTLRKRFDKEDYVAWQEGWGGLFVSSLREIASRCLQIALISAFESVPNQQLISEIMETIGINFYVEISGSQIYGLPLHAMPDLTKRELAERSLLCLEKAASTRKAPDQDGEDNILWDVYLMIGKCHEKIAKTLSAETFVNHSNSFPHTRAYEKSMRNALKAYSMAQFLALSAAKEGDIVEEQGGSAHGASEAVYRLHASRLKCLVSATSCKDSDRPLAEKEALRLTECYWFGEPDPPEKLLSERQRLWRVYVDAVNALAKLREDCSFFHRSVYRHAQAMMWAPVFYDPAGVGVKGSLGSVPSTWAAEVRGLNDSTNAAESALDIIGCLFSKRRKQLVGVWLTGSGTSTAFQTINNSVRKYDSLRGKYISAYMECLTSCGRKKDIDTFLKWALSASRDLPNIFASSVGNEPSSATTSHTGDCLVRIPNSIPSLYFLTEIKRTANSALASVVLQDVSSGTKEKSNGVYLEEQHKIAYACFLRLNIPVGKITKYLNWKNRRTSGVYEVVEALTSAYLQATKESPKANTVTDWSGESQLTSLLLAALKKSKERFPSLTGSFSSFKTKSKPKSKTDDPTTADGKRKGPDAIMVKKSFEVQIPEGVAQGETFLTNIMVGDTMKKIRLTVPEGSASSLRFTLDVPVEDSDDVRPPQKKSNVSS